jgi:hypothetical protein
MPLQFQLLLTIRYVYLFLRRKSHCRGLMLLGCVNMIPDIPAPKEWSKASIKNCVVTVANQNYYLEGIFDRKYENLKNKF